MEVSMTNRTRLIVGSPLIAWASSIPSIPGIFISTMAKSYGAARAAAALSSDKACAPVSAEPLDIPQLVT